MALIYCDGFDHYVTYTQKGWQNSQTDWNGGGIGASYGRFGSGWRQSNYQHGLSRIVSSHGSGVVGFAFRAMGFATGGQLFALLDGTSAQLSLNVTSAGQLYCSLGGSTPIAGSYTANNVLRIGIWHYVEFAYTISDAAGSVQIRVDMSTAATATSVDTKATSNASVDRVHMGSSNSGASATAAGDFDDLYIVDSSGTYATFLGDIRVETRVPNGNGNSSQLVGSDANSTDNYLLVDEAAAPDAADYVESSTPGDKDTYAFTDLASTVGTVYGVQTSIYANKTDAGTRQIAAVARLSGTEVDAATKTLSTTGTYYIDAMETKPGGGTWTISDVNNAEFGVKVVA